jgi:hypothetical protein
MKVPSKWKYLITTGIVKAIICAIIIVIIYTSVKLDSNFEYYATIPVPLIVVAVLAGIAALFVADIFMVAIIKERGIRINTIKDALFTNFVAMTLLGLGLCYIFGVKNSRRGGLYEVIMIVVIMSVLEIVGILYLVTSLFTMLVIKIMSKRLLLN